jgi:hypothetical protein
MYLQSRLSGLQGQRCNLNFESAGAHGVQEHLDINDGNACLCQLLVRDAAPEHEGEPGVELGEAAVEVLLDE